MKTQTPTTATAPGISAGDVEILKEYSRVLMQAEERVVRINKTLDKIAVGDEEVTPQKLKELRDFIAEISPAAVEYQPTAAELQDFRKEEEWHAMMNKHDAQIDALDATLRATDKHADPEGYCAAKDALQSLLEQGLSREDADHLAGLEPIWAGQTRAKSGPHVYLLAKKKTGWDLLVERNETLPSNRIIAKHDESFTLAEARVWAESVIEIFESVFKTVEEETTIKVDGIPRIQYEIEPGKFAVYFEDPVWALAELVDLASEKGVWVAVDRYEGSTSKTPLSFVKSWAQQAIEDLSK